MNNRNEMDIVQLNTMNDYGESHYMRPVAGDQPNSQSWTTNMPHTGEFLRPIFSYQLKIELRACFSLFEYDEVLCDCV